MLTLTSKGKALIRAGRRAYQPTDADRERLLNQLRSRLGDAALPADMSTAASAVTAGSSTWPLVSLVVGVGVLGGALFYGWTRGEDHQPSAQSAPAVAAAQVIEPVTAPADESSEPSVATAPAGTPAAAGPSSASRSKDRLAGEVAILARATRDLRAGRPAEALKSLDDYRRKFPKGVLGEEQRAARVQVLCALGRFDEANANLATLPKQSPLALRAKQFCDGRPVR